MPNRTQADSLDTICRQVAPECRQISDEAAQRKPGPGRWAPKEILGHLIDSATINHARFVTSSIEKRLEFDGYDQEQWVAQQQYLERDWESLISLWLSHNLHLAEAIRRLPDEAVHHSFAQHSLNRIAWKPIPSDVPATLDYLITDYLGHLEHHVRQILPGYQPIVIGTYEYASRS